MEYKKLSAQELHQEIERAKFYLENSGSELFDALTEINRLRFVCQDIVDIVNTDVRLIKDPGDIFGVMSDIENKAQEYYQP